MVVVHPSHTRGLIQGSDTGLLCDVRELPTAIIVKQRNMIAERNRDIVLAVAVVIADGTRDTLTF